MQGQSSDCCLAALTEMMNAWSQPKVPKGHEVLQCLMPALQDLQRFVIQQETRGVLPTVHPDTTRSCSLRTFTRASEQLFLSAPSTFKRNLNPGQNCSTAVAPELFEKHARAMQVQDMRRGIGPHPDYCSLFWNKVRTEGRVC